MSPLPPFFSPASHSLCLNPSNWKRRKKVRNRNLKLPFFSESCENLIKTKDLTFNLIAPYFFDEKLFLEGLLLQVSLFLLVCVYSLIFSHFLSLWLWFGFRMKIPFAHLLCQGIMQTISATYWIDEMYLNTFRKFSAKQVESFVMCCCKLFTVNRNWAL